MNMTLNILFSAEVLECVKNKTIIDDVTVK